MTDEELKKALIDTQDFILSQLPTLDSGHEFPRRVRRTVRKLIRKEMHPIWFEIQRVAAIIFIMLGITSVVILGFNEEARAGVLGWIRERVSSTTSRYQNQGQEHKEISQYTLADSVPDGYTFIRRSNFEKRFSEMYTNESGDILSLYVFAPDYEGEFYVFSIDNSAGNTKHIDSLSADVYISEKEEDSNYIIGQTEDGICFVIMGKLEEQQLIQLLCELEK